MISRQIGLIILKDMFDKNITTIQFSSDGLILLFVGLVSHLFINDFISVLNVYMYYKGIKYLLIRQIGCWGCQSDEFLLGMNHLLLKKTVLVNECHLCLRRMIHTCFLQECLIRTCFLQECLVIRYHRHLLVPIPKLIIQINNYYLFEESFISIKVVQNNQHCYEIHCEGYFQRKVLNWCWIDDCNLYVGCLLEKEVGCSWFYANMSNGCDHYGHVQPEILFEHFQEFFNLLVRESKTCLILSWIVLTLLSFLFLFLLFCQLMIEDDCKGKWNLLVIIGIVLFVVFVVVISIIGEKLFYLGAGFGEEEERKKRNYKDLFYHHELFQLSLFLFDLNFLKEYLLF